MKVYDSAGRRKIAALWAAIAGKPDRILEIEALTDPGELRFVGWNTVSSSLELLPFASSDIPYDNTTSGLTATDVQAALDELAAGAGGTVYAGYINSAGTTASSSLPDGWTVSRPQTGRYRVVHGLNLANDTDLVVVAQGIGVNNSTYKTSINTLELDRFDIFVDSNSPPINSSVFFHAKLFG